MQFVCCGFCDPLHIYGMWLRRPHAQGLSLSTSTHWILRVELASSYDDGLGGALPSVMDGSDVVSDVGAIVLSPYNVYTMAILSLRRR